MVTFQLTDIPRLLPELMLLVMAFLVLSSDLFERWNSDPETLAERGRASGMLATVMFGLIFVVTLLQSGYIFRFSSLLPAGSTTSNNPILNVGLNLQASGPGGIPILGAFETDHLTTIARLLLIGSACLVSLIALNYNENKQPGEFYALLAFATAGLCLMSGASELITAYISLELSAIALYVLTGYFRTERESSEAGLKYFLFGAISSAILLYGMSLAYGFTASANVGRSPTIGTLFSSIAAAAQNSPNDTLLTLALVFIIGGMSYKIAAVPFHSWAPDVYQGAPTPITAFLSTASKSAGFILLYRMLTTIFPAQAGSASINFGGWTGILALIALATLLFGNLAALPQNNAKRLLAYSSIAHAGFLLLTLVLWAKPSASAHGFGTSSMLYYLIAYSLTSIGAFAALAAIKQAVGGDELSDLNGLAKRNTGLALMFTVLILSLAGIPPLAGFWGKFFVFMSGYRSGAVWLVVVAVFTTLISLYYYLRFLRAMWISEPSNPEPIEIAGSIRATLIITTALIVVLGIFPNIIWNLIGQAATIASGS